MILSLFRSADPSPIPNQLYGILVAAARDPDLYVECGIEDSTMGRFELLSLHIFLFTRRMRDVEVSGADDVSQEVFDLYVDGVEIALRELGIGDTSVPKRKKRMIHSFFGLVEDLEAPLDANNRDKLERAVTNRFYAGGQDSKAPLLVDYIVANSELLANTPVEDILDGHLNITTISELADHV